MNWIIIQFCSFNTFIQFLAPLVDPIVNVFNFTQFRLGKSSDGGAIYEISMLEGSDKHTERED